MDHENLVFSLIERGWYQTDSFLDHAVCQNLLSELHTLPLRPAKIGKGSSSQIANAIRNDSLYWLQESTASVNQQIYFQKMNELMHTLNKELYLGLKQFEGHFARYDQNGFYKKHLDQFKGNSERLVSVITYLNTPSSGGELRIYSRDDSERIEADIKPVTGSLVCFLSNQIYHEVRPTTSERYSIAGWLRTTIL